MNLNIRKKLDFMRDVLKRPGPEASQFRYRDLIFFSRFVGPFWRLSALSLLLTILVTGLTSLVPLSSKVLIDFVVMKQGAVGLGQAIGFSGLKEFLNKITPSLASLRTVITALLFIGITAGLTGIVQRYLAFRLQQELTFNIQTALFDHILRFPLSFFRKTPVGYLSSRISDDINALQAVVSQVISDIIPRFFYFMFGIVIVLMISPRLSLILAGILPVYVLSNYFFGRRLRAASLSEFEQMSQVTRDMQEAIAGVETIKAYAAEQSASGRVSGRVRSLVSARTQRMIITLLSEYSSRSLQFISTLFVMWIGVHEISEGRMTIGDYVAFTSYILILSGSVNSISRSHMMLQPVFASIERMRALFSLIPELPGGRGGSKPAAIRGEIRFDDVSFSYEDGHPVLRNISFAAHPGQVVALVGPSGAGKTTIINLLLKFYLPISGSITLDGHRLPELDTQWVRQQAGFVSQDVFLFNDTLEKNIRFGDPSATPDDVISAATASGIHEFIMSLPDRYDAVVGERGMKLSAGQRQRISIARAFLKKPSLLIFDEPTSALDPESEEFVKTSLKKLSAHRTILIIAHRLATVSIADNILVIENGEIRETGNHEKLLRSGGIYSRLFDKQSRCTEDNPQ